MPPDSTDDQSTLVQVIAWCRQATSHYLNQYWPRSLPPCGVTRPQWANEIVHFLYFMEDEAFQFTFMVMPECYDPHTSLIVQQTDGYWTSVLLYPLIREIIPCQTDIVPERSSQMWSVLSKYNLAALNAFTLILEDSSTAVRESCYFPISSEIFLKDAGKLTGTNPQYKNETNCESCAYFLRCTLWFG